MEIHLHFHEDSKPNPQELLAQIAKHSKKPLDALELKLLLNIAKYADDLVISTGSLRSSCAAELAKYKAEFGDALFA